MVNVNKHAWWLLPVLGAALLGLFGFQSSPYIAYLLTSWVIFGLVAFSLDLVWGRGGDLSLGQTVFFGLGAYVYGIAGANLAPIMGNTYLLVVLFGAIAGGFVAALVGYFIYYGRLGPLQTTIITYAMVLIMGTVAISTTFRLGTARVGGANGMTGIPPLSFELLGFNGPFSRQGAFVATLIAVLIIVLLTVHLLRKPFGMVIDGIRLDALKTELLGYDVRRYRLVLFTLAGAISGIAGGFFGAWSAYISPSVFGVTQALLIPIYVLVGGRGSLYGAFIGAVFVGWLTFWLGGGVAGGQTSLILGAVLIGIVLFAPNGLVGLLKKIRPTRTQAVQSEASEANIEALNLLFVDEPEQKVILETQALEKRFGGVVATDNVSLKFYNKGIHCLIGPNGAGKSTFLNTCVGVIKPDTGKILFEGRDITKMEPCDRVRLGIGIKLQVAKVLEELTVEQNLWLAGYGRSGDKQQATRMVRDVLPVIGLSHRAKSKAADLSHGEQQWLDIGMVLCLRPKLIFLDEPAAGMTGMERTRTVEILRQLSKYVGIVVVEHDMDFIRALESPVTVLHQGALFASGSIDELRENPDVLDIYLGRPHNA